VTRKNDRKLALRKQSLRRLDDAELGAARGGIILVIAPALGTNYATKAVTNWYGIADTMGR
jgi:hypothetical protein